MRTKLYLACEADSHSVEYSRRDFDRLMVFADKSDQFEVVKDVKEAKLVLFVGSSEVNFNDVRRSAVYKNYKDKSVIFYSGDRMIPILPGLYPCLEKNMLVKNSRSRQSSYYLRVTDNQTLDTKEPINDAKYLYSFLGNCRNHPVRAEILQLRHPRALLADTSTAGRRQTDANNEYYLTVIKQSKFVLCPRGIGVSSWRLFETMRAGRVPVIISDDWVEPPGPDWKQCSVRIAESQLRKINMILEEYESEAEELASNARRDWLKYYSEDNVFDTIANQALDSLNESKKNNRFNVRLYLYYFSPYFFRFWILSPLKQCLMGLRKN